MKNFISKDYLLTTDFARELYHRYAEGEPIIDYHCHLSPREIAENKKFSNITELWLYADHYKWRAMRGNGVPEEFITGSRSSYEKFEKWEWIYGHSPRATLNFSKRLACGTVHIHLNIAENRINSCQFGGDFIGNLPTNELEKALTSLPYDRDAIYKVLTQKDVSRYFDGVTAIELLQLIIQ